MHIPESEDLQEVSDECQRTENPGIPGMVLFYRTPLQLPHVRLLLVGEVRACLPAPCTDRTGRAAAALSERDTLPPGMEDRVQPGGGVCQSDPDRTIRKYYRSGNGSGRFRVRSFPAAFDP